MSIEYSEAECDRMQYNALLNAHEHDIENYRRMLGKLKGFGLLSQDEYSGLLRGLKRLTLAQTTPENWKRFVNRMENP